MALLPVVVVASGFDEKLRVHILLDVENNGKAWYLSPVSRKYVYLGRPDEAYGSMRGHSIILDEMRLSGLNGVDRAPAVLGGLFVRGHEGLFYAHPDTLEISAIHGPAEAFALMRDSGLGARNVNIKDGRNGYGLNTGSASVLDMGAYEDFGAWWGVINKDLAPVYAAATSTAKRLGYLNKANRIKIIESLDKNGLWHRIDGGVYPGAFVLSDHVDRSPQPLPPADPAIPEEVRPGKYWIDVDLGRNILSLFLYDKAVFSTYVSSGRLNYPTITGSFTIKNKLKSTRMSGGPPRFDAPYDLKNVPHTMYYHGSFAIHGTYWHDKFSTRQSHGCTNLTRGDAEFVFERASVGTIVRNHY